MSQEKNLPISLSIAEEFLEARDSADIARMTLAARALQEEITRAHGVLQQGFLRKSLTVCNGKIGYVDPADASRFLSGEIPRLTIYKKKKDAHNMGLYFQRPPKFYRENQAKPVRKPVKAKK